MVYCILLYKRCFTVTVPAALITCHVKVQACMMHYVDFVITITSN